MINLNSTASWFSEDTDGTETIVPRHDTIDVVSVSQLEKDTILVCSESKPFFSLIPLSTTICFA